MDMIQKRYLAIEMALIMSEQKIPYGYGDNDPEQGGIDCSGLVRFILRVVGLFPWRSDSTARGFLSIYKDNKVPVPYMGCLAFYGEAEDARKMHIVWCVDEKTAVGATLFDGWQGVQKHPINYRDDLLCYVDPFLTDK